MQVLIQFAAASYKVEQCREGCAAEAMQRGMEGLIERARQHLNGGRGLGALCGLLAGR